MPFLGTIPTCSEPTKTVILSTFQTESIHRQLDDFRIELPSWGFANTGTRFGKFLQPGAAVTLPEKLADAAEVHRVTGCCPTLAVHVLWDFPNGIAMLRM